MKTPRSRWLRRCGRFLSGIVACALLLGLAELFVRWFPPQDLHPYLGEECPDSGPYRADEHLAVAYRSWDAFHADNPAELAPFEPVEQPCDKPIWAMFGNSFVQAPGMLADTARRELPQYRIFNLGKNEHLPLRIAQIQLLLERGLRPQRIFFELMPVDVVGIGQQPLHTWEITQRGAITFRPGSPPLMLADLPHQSRLALTAWCRTGKHHGNRQFNRSRLCREVVSPLQADLRQLFAHLAALSRKHDVPITVLLLPTYHQVCAGEGWVFQDTLGPIFREQWLDVFDVREPFVSDSDKPSLFIPDKHFSDRGNHILLQQVIAHVQAQEAPRR